MKKAVFFIFFLLAGLLAGVGVTLLLGILPVPFDHPVLAALGIHKPQIVGFTPYWLLSKANKSYSPYITTRTYFGLTIDTDGRLKKLDNPREEEPGWTNLRTDATKRMLAEDKKAGQKLSLLVVSGDDEVIGHILANPRETAENVVADAAPIMAEFGFNDLNLDVETFMTASTSSRMQYTEFVRTVRERLDRKHTLTIDIPPISLVKEQIYDARAIGALVDAVVIMTYDYHYLGSYTAGAVAPVGGAGDSVEFDVETAVKETLKAVPKEKILLGIPLYGYEWETIGDSPESATIPGGASTASTARIADTLAGCATCSAKFDWIARAPYSIIPENSYYHEYYYENEQSMQEKVELAKRYKLGGIALWALGYEDTTILRPLAEYKKTFRLTWW